MHNRSKSTLFLMEQLIAILVFAFCAAACVKTFVTSYMMVVESNDRNNALIVAESYAEGYKAVHGSLSEASAVLGGTVSSDEHTLVVYYDKKWQACEAKDAFYILNLINRQQAEIEPTLVLGDISIVKSSGDEIISFTTAARSNLYE